MYDLGVLKSPTREVLEKESITHLTHPVYDAMVRISQLLWFQT
jgi:hypothetical protein